MFHLLSLACVIPSTAHQRCAFKEARAHFLFYRCTHCVVDLVLVHYIKLYGKTQQYLDAYVHMDCNIRSNGGL